MIYEVCSVDGKMCKFHCLPLFVGSESWLQTCEISVCPTGDVIALARQTRLIVLSSKWDSNLSSTQYQISFSSIPHENDVITAVLCLPIVGQTQNSDVCNQYMNQHYYYPDDILYLLGWGRLDMYSFRF